MKLLAKVGLHPIVNNINMPTVIKTAILPSESIEKLFIATQVGEIYYVTNGVIETFLDIRSQVLKLGSSGGYDERGLLGVAFHPLFNINGLFYIHYSVVESQGPGALPGFFQPNPCDINTINLKWTDRETSYDHVDTVEEWGLINGQPQKIRTLLNIRRPFLNHNGVNSLNFSPETGKLILTTGDGGSGYDPFNLSQDDMEIAGKIIEIDVNFKTNINNPPIVTRFDELPVVIQEMLEVIAKGVRNITGISYQRLGNQYMKYIGIVGQELVESIFSFGYYNPIPVTQIVNAYLMKSQLDLEGFINFGWRGWEGDFPTSIIRSCASNVNLDEKIIAYYNEAINTSSARILPLTCYYHEDTRPNKFQGTALTGIKPYMSDEIPDLMGKIIFCDLVQNIVGQPAKGVLCYTDIGVGCKLNDYSVIDINYDFKSKPAYYVSLGANMNQTRLFLGVYGSMLVGTPNQGTIFEIVP